MPPSSPTHVLVTGRPLTVPTTGELSVVPLPPPRAPGDLRPLHFFKAHVSGASIEMNELHLFTEWSTFEDCHFTQRLKPILNEFGTAAQGSLGNRPTLYRNCTFERVRFKLMGGFSMGHALFENCTFLKCRWEGNFAYDAWLVNNRFVGKMNGCVWFGRGGQGPDGDLNLIRGNDFTETQFTPNVGWRDDFPIRDQLWPEDYTPRVRD